MKLSLLVLRSRVPERLRAFYAALGIVFVEEKHGAGPVHFAGAVGETILELYPQPGETSPPDPARLGLTVDNLDESLRSLAGLGEMVAAPRQTEWGLRAVVRDPDGLSVELYQAF
jgi:catechol 2,3-dioxygenase-like lactoylglutathione lyase family enzyme